MTAEFWLVIAGFVIANAAISGVAIRGALRARREERSKGETCKT